MTQIVDIKNKKGLKKTWKFRDKRRAFLKKHPQKQVVGASVLDDKRNVKKEKATQKAFVQSAKDKDWVFKTCRKLVGLIKGKELTADQVSSLTLFILENAHVEKGDLVTNNFIKDELAYGDMQNIDPPIESTEEGIAILFNFKSALVQGFINKVMYVRILNLCQFLYGIDVR